MTLETSHKLAHYEILELIGKGGMGEVYRAKDSKLGRDVAIKVLPEDFAQDEERLRRFQREAKLLASLNHPNIASIYGLEQCSTKRSVTHYLVLELVPGETLAERIARGPIPLEEILDIAHKIADALEDAHEQGIVHRDLKPSNIKLTEDGKVKVLDFGLAKAFVDEMADIDSSLSPTITRDATQVGVILGTAAYMSPEQAKGKRVDRRTDIFAFGAVLYEMLTRRKAFPGDDVSEVLAAVIKSEPDWSRLPQPRLRHVLERCLHKDTRLRYHHIADARLELAEAASAPAPEAVPRPKARLPWAVAALMALVAGLAVWTSGPSDRATRAPVRLSLNFGHGLGSLDAAGLAISPDGTHVVHRTRTGPLYVRELGRDEWVPIPGTEGAQTPFFSPDGNWLGFVAAGKLMKVQLDGAGAAVIAEGLSTRGESWGPDDTIVAATVGSGLRKIHASGGAPEALTDVEEGEVSHRWPEILPNGKGVVFSIVTSADYDDSDIVVQSFETGERRFLVTASFARYAPTGHLIYAREGTLYAMPFDADRLEATGSGIPVQTGVSMTSAGPGVAHFAFSDTGTLVWLAKPRMERRLFLVDLQGKASAIAAPAGPYEQARFAPDGRRLAVTVAGEGAGREIHVYELEQERMSLVASRFEGASPEEVFKPIIGSAWSPDGKSLTINGTARRQGLNLFLIAADGTGAVERLTDGPGYQFPEQWSVDGKRLLFTDLGDHTRGWGIFEWNRENGGVRTVLDPAGAQAQPVVSPDGSWLAYTSLESGGYEVYITRYPDLGQRQQVSTGGGTAAVWAPEGRTLYYRNGPRVMQVGVTTDPQLSVSAPTVLFESPYFSAPGYNSRAYDLSPDGRHFVMIRTEEGDTEPKQFQVVLHWFEELERLVPTH